MKKFLSSTLVFTIALTSFSAFSCFASEEPTYISEESAPAASIPSEKSYVDQTTQAETLPEIEMNLSQEKKINYVKVSSYVAGAIATAACAYLGYSNRQDISKFAQDSYNNYIPSISAWFKDSYNNYMPSISTWFSEKTNQFLALLSNKNAEPIVVDQEATVADFDFSNAPFCPSLNNTCPKV